MNNLPNNHHKSLEPVSNSNDDKLEGNRKTRRNFDRIKRKAKKALMKAGYKVKR